MSGVSDEGIQGVQDLLSRYVGQLLYGCGDKACTETTCITGRRNTTKRPIRDYTPRSARAIAITLALESRPRARPCPRYRPERAHGVPTPQEGPQDPNSLMQQLCDTDPIRRICNPSATPIVGDLAPTARRVLHREAAEWRATLNQYLRCFRDTDPEIPLSSLLEENQNVAEQLHLCIQWLAGTVPRAQAHEWEYANTAVQHSRSTPVQVDEEGLVRADKVIELIRSLDPFRPTFDVFCRILRVINLRGQNEAEASCMPTRKSSSTSTSESYTAQKLEQLVLDGLMEQSVDCVRAPVFVWLKRVFLEYWNESTILAKDSVLALVLRMHDSLGPGIDQALGAGSCRLFPAISSELDATTVAKTYLEVEDDKTAVHLLDFPALFSTQELVTYFRVINYSRMQKGHIQSEIQTQIYEREQQLLHRELDEEPEGRAGFLAEHYLLLRISRQNVVQDAFDQLWQRRKSELLRPLRIRLGETEAFEVGHDLGGVQIEFFNLFWRELLSEDAGLFATDESTNLSHFRPGSLQPLYMSEMAGMFFGLAIFNGITLPINLPLALYQWLTSRGKYDPVVSDRWPEIERSLQSLLDEEGVPDLEAVVPFEANGLRLNVLTNRHPSAEFKDHSRRVPIYVTEATRIMHQRTLGSTAKAISYGKAVEAPPEPVDISSIETAWPGWRLEQYIGEVPELTAENKEEYVKFFKIWLAWGSVAPQLHAFTKGFSAILPSRTIAFLTAEQLRGIAEGTSTFSIDAFQEATEYDGYDENSRYIRIFWRLVKSWPEEKQRKLLKFVTAIERMPTHGVSTFRWRIERPIPDEPDKLPTSSTCFRTLYLPRYPNADVLDKKLSLAFEYGLEGFGTG